MTYLDNNSAVKGRSSAWSELTRRCSQRRHLQSRYWCFWIVGALIPLTLLRMVYLSDYGTMKGQSSVLDFAAGMMESSTLHQSRHIDEATSSTFLERSSEGSSQMKTYVQEFLRWKKRKQESKPEPERSLEVKDEEPVSLPNENSGNIESVALINGENQNGTQEEKHHDGKQEMKQEKKDEKLEEKHHDGKQEKKDEKLEEKHHYGKQEKKDEKLEEKHHDGKQEKKDEKLEEKHHDGKQEKKDQKLEEKHHDGKQEKKDQKLKEKHHDGKQEKKAEKLEKLEKQAGEHPNSAEERHNQQEEAKREEATHAQEKELITNESEGDGQKQAEPHKGVDERGQAETGEKNEDRREAEHSEAISQKEAERQEEGAHAMTAEAKDERRDETELKDAESVEKETIEEQNQATEKENLDEKPEDGGSVTQETMDSTEGVLTEEAKSSGKCDLFEGDWVWDPEGPLYTNSTCFYMQGTQNCMGNGRPDTNYLHWKWKPRDCDLPRFDARAFLEAFRGKTLAFVGDSLARNQMQSLLCMLSQIQVPRVIYQSDDDSTVRWLYEEHQVTLAVVWSPYLLKESHDGIMGYEKGQSVLYLDELDTAWTSVMQDFDIIVLSIGQWFFKGSVYVAEDEVVGCHYCPEFNLTEIGFADPYRGAVRQVLEKMASEFKGIAIMSTFAISHFEDGPYSDGGQCKRENPLSKEEGATFPGMHNEMHDIVMSEFNKIAYDKSKLNENVTLEFLDVTKVSLTRADGHPGAYRMKHPYLGRNPDEWVPNDCLHWCLPGPVDTWNQLLVKIASDIFASSQNNFILSEAG